MSADAAVGSGAVEAVGSEGQALSHGHGGGGEGLQVVLQRLQIVRQLAVDALHLDEKVVGAFVHLLHTSVNLRGWSVERDAQRQYVVIGTLAPILLNFY